MLSQFDMQLQVDGVDKTVDVDFIMTGVGLDAGGDITFLTRMVGGERVMRRRNMGFSRATDFQQLGDLQSSTLNNDQDAPVMMLQQLNDDVGRSLKLPLSSTASAQILTIDPLKPLAGNAAGDAIEFGDTELTGDMLLRPNLASDTPSYGSTLVTHTRASGAGYARTQKARNDDIVPLFDFIAPGNHANILAGTDLNDHATEVQAALN